MGTDNIYENTELNSSKSNTSIFLNLNESQKEAVQSTEGNVRVIAGAGAGKTKVLAHRYAYIVKVLGISASSIACLTFTRKASNEMKQRIKKLLGGDFISPLITTIHGLCVRMLHEDASKLFFPNRFIILDTADQKKILEEIYEELDIRLDSENFKTMLDQIRNYKSKSKYLDYFSDPEADFLISEPSGIIDKVIFRYLQKQRKYFGLDFSDLINCTMYLFEKRSDILEKWQNRLHYVQVDEFQDITSKEFSLLQQLTGFHKNLFVVGDPDQNIYEWRGSKMSIFMDFDRVIIPTKTIFLNKNYRSSPEILQVSNSLISKNQNRIKKNLFTENESSIKPEHFHGKSDFEEVDYIVRKIKSNIQNGMKYSSMAILYRSNYLSRYLEQGLRAEKVPYDIHNGIGFFERAEIKDILSYLRLVAFGDDLSFKRIVNVPKRKLGKKKMEFIFSKAELLGTTLYEALLNYVGTDIFKNTSAKEFINAIEYAKSLKDANMPVSEILQQLLINTKYEQYIRESGDIERFENVTEFIHYIVSQENDYGEYLPLDTLLEDITIYTESDDKNDDCIKLTNIHTAKGLEFDTVFLAGMNDGIIPSARALEERKADALEEERRLCFVALTRARKQLFLSENEGNDFRGISKVPSRFLFDIDENLITRVGNISSAIIDHFGIQATCMSNNSELKYCIGTKVIHKIFGEGCIEDINDNGKTYIIRFSNFTRPISFDYEGITELE